MENAPNVLSVLRRNIEACDTTGSNSRVLAVDVSEPPRATQPCDMVFMDPPYGRELWRQATSALTQAGWMAEGAICCIELGREDAFETLPGFGLLDDRRYGAARMVVLMRQI